MRDLDGGECLDMDLRKSRLEAAKHLGVVLEARLHVEPPDDVKLPCHGAVCRCRFGVHLFHGVPVGALFFRQPRVRAEDTRLAKRADIRRIDVMVRGERHAMTVLSAIDGVGHVADTEEVRGLEQGDAVRLREALPPLDLVREG